MKALILCAGAATRLRPLTNTRAKAAVPVANRPVLVRIVEYLASVGIRSVGVVTAPAQGDLLALEPAIHSLGVEITWLQQERPLGIAHALLTARPYLEDAPFLLYLGDNLTDENLAPVLDAFSRSDAAALLLVRGVANPGAFGVAVVRDGYVEQVVEKPVIAPSNLAITGIYLFRPAIWPAAQAITPSARGELEITDAIARLLQTGQTVLAHEITGWWQDIGSPASLLTANRELLEHIRADIAPDVSVRSCQIEGRVQIGEGCRLEHSVLRGPLIVGKGCLLRRAFVGPYTSLGDRVVLDESSVEHSILLSSCHLQQVRARLSDCLLGEGVRLYGHGEGILRLLVGDDTEMHLLREWR